MTEKVATPEIAPYLKEAHLLFCEELASHIAFFRGVVERVSERKKLSEDGTREEQLAISRRAHLIKGGAGFFRLETVVGIGHELEEAFSREMSTEQFELKVSELLKPRTDELRRYLLSCPGAVVSN